MGPGFSASISSLRAINEEIASVSSNIANAGATGAKGVETFSYAVHNNMRNGGYRGISSGVSSINKIRIDTPGTPIMTGIPTHLMINGKGLFIVADPSDNIVYTRTGDFEITKDNNLVNGSGGTLLGWTTDSEGEISENSSTIDSLQPISIQKAIASASATTAIDVSLVLNSVQNVAGMGEAILSFASDNTQSPYNANITKDDIIYPDDYNALTVGEGLSLQVNNQIYLLEYGGFASTIPLDAQDTDLVANGTTILTTDEIGVTVDNFNLNPFTRGDGSTNLEVLQNLVEQINSTNGPYSLTARIIKDESNKISLLIAPQSAEYSLSFSGSQVFRNQTGLTDASNTLDAGQTLRFASMQNISDILNTIPGVEAINSNGKDVRLNISSVNPIYIDNYNPFGGGTNFLREFGISKGYLSSEYNPYDQSKNMAGGGFKAHYTKDFTIYDSMGSSHNFLLRFLKVDTNKWAVEVHAANPTTVELNGRTDGLLMAGFMNFDGYGNLLYIEEINEPAVSAISADPAIPIGAAEGQTFELQIGNTNYVFNYSIATAVSANINGASNTLTTAGSGGSDDDTLNIAVNGNLYSFTRGNGATNLDVLYNFATQINNTVGLDALTAEVVYDSSGAYNLEIKPLDIRSSLTFSSTDTGASTISSILAFNAIAADSARFSNLYELTNLLNATGGMDGVEARLSPADSLGIRYNLSITPLTPGRYMQFSGSVDIIDPPLGNGTDSTIIKLLNIPNTSASTAITGLKNTMTINWSGEVGAAPNEITINWGNIGSKDGISQVAKEYSVRRLEQNGVSIGELVDLQINDQGYVIANFSNSTTRKIYKIAIADFGDINGLNPGMGGFFYPSDAAGEINLKEAGKEGAGTIQSGVCESSNIDSTKELSAVSALVFRYQASANMLQTFSKLNDYLIQALV